MKSLTDREIASIPQTAKTIAVVGASDNPSRDSYSIMNFLLNHRYTVIPVNPNYKSVLGLYCYPSLVDIHDKIDIVDIFRRPEETLPIVEDAIRVKAKTVWMQLGVYNKDTAERAAHAGLNVIYHRCIKVDYMSLIGS
jgi:predicted CoA-binding protein